MVPTDSANSRSSAARSVGRWRRPFTRRNCLPALIIRPHTSAVICPSRQRLTLAACSRLTGISAPLALRLLLRAMYRPAATLTLNADRIGPGLFIQHGVATIVTAESIGSHCWINQQVTIGHNATGRPTLGDRVRVGAGAVVIGPITLHDGATVGANATVIHDVGPGETVVAPLASALNPRAAGTATHQPRHPEQVGKNLRGEDGQCRRVHDAHRAEPCRPPHIRDRC